MKKILALVLVLTMAVSMTACGGSGEAGGQEQEKVKKNPVRSELYDESGRLLADISYEYDENGRRLSNTTDWCANDELEKDVYTYDADGNVASVTTYFNGSDTGFAVNYEYDENGNMVKAAYGDGSYGTKYTYDENGHLKESFSYNMDNDTLMGTYTYDEATNTQVEKQVMGDWEYVYTTVYNEDGDTLKWEYACNGELMTTHNYTYDADGNLTQQDVSIESWKLEGYVVHYFE